MSLPPVVEAGETIMLLEVATAAVVLVVVSVGVLDDVAAAGILDDVAAGVLDDVAAGVLDDVAAGVLGGIILESFIPLSLPEPNPLPIAWTVTVLDITEIDSSNTVSE